MKNKLLAFPLLAIGLLLLFTQCCRMIALVGIRTHFERDLSKEEQQKVVWTSENTSICGLENDSLYAISGEQLKNASRNTTK